MMQLKGQTQNFIIYLFNLHLMEGGKNSYYQPKKWVILYKKYEKIWVVCRKSTLEIFYRFLRK